MEGSLNGGFRRKKCRIRATAEEEIYDETYSGENICKVAHMYVFGGKSLQTFQENSDGMVIFQKFENSTTFGFWQELQSCAATVKQLLVA